MSCDPEACLHLSHHQKCVRHVTTIPYKCAIAHASFWEVVPLEELFRWHYRGAEALKNILGNTLESSLLSGRPVIYFMMIILTTWMCFDDVCGM